MSRQLPERPSLRHLRNQAKQLLKSHQASESGAATRIHTYHPQLESTSKTDILNDAFTLQDAQLVIAREYGFESWPKLVAGVEAILSDLPESSQTTDPYELLEGYDLGEKAVLEGAQIEGLKLKDANLRNAKMPGSSFRNADFESADLEGVKMPSANMNDMRFRGERMKPSIDAH